MIYFAWAPWVLYLASFFTLADFINGCFELGGGLLSILNIRVILRDKKVRGMALLPLTFITAWGFWNVFYYPFLSQWLSFVGGIVIVTVNVAWLALAVYYTRKERRDRQRRVARPGRLLHPKRET